MTSTGGNARVRAVIRRVGRDAGRAGLAAVLSLAGLVAPSRQAEAVEFVVDEISVSSGYAAGSNVLIPVGATVTIGSRISDPSASPVLGVAASYSRWDRNILAFVSGSSVRSLFRSNCPIGTGGTGGFQNLVPNPLVETRATPGGAAPGATRVQAIVAFSLSPQAANADDPGLDEQCGANDAQMRLTFQGAADGQTTVVIGTGEDLGAIVVGDGGENLAATNAAVIVTVPEPGEQALVLAGVVLLSALGTSSRSVSPSRPLRTRSSVRGA